MSSKRAHTGCPWRALAAVILSSSSVLTLCGCTSLREYIHNGFEVGPDYRRPPSPVAENWIDATDSRLKQGPAELCSWWTVFNDPVLDNLIQTAYQQNLTLRQAGFRILQARAFRGITIGQLFPQTQFADGSFTKNAQSIETVNSRFIGNRFFDQWNLGFTVAWELDFWGRFRRAVESSTANLDASVEDYDAVLVTLLSDVATAYVQIRTFEERIRFATENAAIQRKTFQVAEGRFKAGTVRDLDVAQAGSVLAQTEAAIPELEIALRQFQNQLCILLGIPPEDLLPKLGPAGIPKAPPEVAIGIPADLLRRRPEVRRAERQAAAQSALIGVSEAEFYPHISLVGDLNYSAERFKDVFSSTALNGSFGPTFQWNVLQYGRILNDVRLQDARFQELAAAYQQSVLTAQQEVENGLATFLKAQKRVALQAKSVADAARAVKLINTLFEGGLVDITQVTQLQLILVQAQDTLAQAQGEVPTGLIQVYRALGGGWEIRCQPAVTETAAPTP